MLRKRTLKLGLALFAFLGCLDLHLPAAVDAAEIKIAAAADLTFVFKDVVARFEKQTGNSAKLTYGSSGNFFSQIQNGAPFDLFFSADVNFPRKLEAAGLTEPGSIYEYARGEIVIWVPNASKLDLSKGLTVLLDPSIRKIAIANPLHAPYGAAAVAAMKHAGIYEQVKDKLVQGENISQAAQFVHSGNAEVGIVALSLALAPAMKSDGRYVVIPPGDYPPLIQAAVILKSSQEKAVANQFLKFLKESGTVALMRQYGFAVPEDIAAAHGNTSASQ
ncbi:MAG: molybdate ABC transporter substrate-binding protein [Deltaproteobacteria bacterium]|nr:molybdate ABC transporter substrate-binding protein [Deltaproteobacteria bacterium]